jgi:hypothetical protein
MLQEAYGEECDLGSGNAWHDSSCYPNCKTHNEPLERVTTSIPCDFDSDELDSSNPIENYYCEHQLYLGDDYNCGEGYNIWVGGCIDVTDFDNTGQTTQCDTCEYGLLKEYWCDQSLIASDGSDGAVVYDYFACENLIDFEGGIVPDTEEAYLLCQSDGGLPSCLGLPEPASDNENPGNDGSYSSCNDGIVGVCSGNTCYTASDGGEICAPKDCLNCWEDCGLCFENNYCDDGTNNRPDAGEHCASDCTEDNMPGCLSNSDPCESCIGDGICSSLENNENSPSDCCTGCEGSVYYDCIAVGGQNLGTGVVPCFFASSSVGGPTPTNMCGADPVLTDFGISISGCPSSTWTMPYLSDTCGCSDNIGCGLSEYSGTQENFDFLDPLDYHCAGGELECCDPWGGPGVTPCAVSFSGDNNAFCTGGTECCIQRTATESNSDGDCWGCRCTLSYTPNTCYYDAEVPI